MSVSADTIFALSSAPGRAGVSVFRVSGPQASSIIESLTQKPCPVPRQAVLRDIYRHDEIIDSALVLYMSGPKSFTGEDVAEFQTHGSLAVIEAVAACLLSAGASQARAGEFTRRAFLNGRMDLTEAEGLADLIDSETDGQRKQAMRQMQGGLRETYEDWRTELIDALAMIEGEIDFPDEGDVPDALARRAGPYLIRARDKMQQAVKNADRGERVRSGIDLVVVGAPNAGKSSIINKLAGRDAAIVSDQAGTTRDIIDVQMTIAGLPVRLSDTAGLRVSANEIEAEGVRRAQERASQSDLCLLVYDSSQDGSSEHNVYVSDFTVNDRGYDAIIANKSDLLSHKDKKVTQTGPKLSRDIPLFSLSAETGEGFSALTDWLEAEIINRYSPQNLPGLTRARHVDCVNRAIEAVSRGHDNLSIAAELAGEDVRTALHAIKELAGETDMEAVFDRIFSRFCIGK